MGGLSTAGVVRRTAVVVLLTGSAIVVAGAPAAAANRIEPAGWALDRLDQFVRQPRDRAFRYHDALSGAGVTIYVLSAGTFDGAEADLAGRTIAPLGFGGSSNASGTLDPDCRDTGAEAAGLASLAAGATFGVAKRAHVRFLQISACWVQDTAHTTVHHDDVVEAVDWVTDHGDRPAVAMLDYAGVDRTGHLDASLSRSVQSGVTWTVPAREGCDHSHAWLDGAWLDGLVVAGATDRNDAFVGRGGDARCADIFAPGPGAASLVPVGGATTAAAALTAGVIAQYLDVASTWSPAALEQHLKEQATAGAVRGLPPDAPDLLLHSAWWGPVLGLTCGSIVTRSAQGRFTCSAVDLNGPSDAHRWRWGNGRRPGWDDRSSITGTCAVGRLYTFQVEATRYGHADTASFAGLPCRLAR